MLTIHNHLQEINFSFTIEKTNQNSLQFLYSVKNAMADLMLAKLDNDLAYNDMTTDVVKTLYMKSCEQLKEFAQQEPKAFSKMYAII